ncbi:hypothetical protein [Paenibacillus paridis]|uniref:hypothetical protein n=1 Tax=Paenibacillus paridis TaxID=2583376 RepID=UPI001EE43E9A|nr:hypothetical protein [Paenibacillus paridis]
MLIGVIGFLAVFPYLSSSAMMLVHHKNTGITALDYSQKGSSCRYATQDNVVHMQCQLTLMNYGSESKEVRIEPLFTEYDSGLLASVNIKNEGIVMPRRSSRTYHINFEGNVDDALFVTGSTNIVGVKFIDGSQEKET